MQGSVRELAETFDVAEGRIRSALHRAGHGGRLRPSQRLVGLPVEPHSRLHGEALATFERQVLEGVIRHDGDPVIEEQLALDPAVDRFENGDPRRLRKLERSRPIDISVALALAIWRVVHGGTRSVYETRGLLAV